MLWYERNKTLADVRSWENNEIWTGNSNSASSHGHVVDYFPIIAQRGEFNYLQKKTHQISSGFFFFSISNHVKSIMLSHEVLTSLPVVLRPSSGRIHN